MRRRPLRRLARGRARSLPVWAPLASVRETRALCRVRHSVAAGQSTSRCESRRPSPASFGMYVSSVALTCGWQQRSVASKSSPARASVGRRRCMWRDVSMGTSAKVDLRNGVYNQLFVLGCVRRLSWTVSVACPAPSPPCSVHHQPTRTRWPVRDDPPGGGGQTLQG